MEYTPEQKKAIETVTQNLVVTAGAGAGKTKVLVDRILYILEQGLANIDEIVAITYTKKAALEIRERLRKEMIKRKDEGDFSKGLEKLGIAYIGTIHSFCLRLLMENPVEAGIDSDAKVIEEYRSKAWMKESIRETIIDNLENKSVFQLTSELGFSKLSNEIYELMSKMQNQGLRPAVINTMAETEDEKAIALLIEKTYKLYNLKKEEQSFLDYEDILQKTLDLLKENKAILCEYQRKFRFILIDEYQDLNFVQDEILRLLGKDTNLFVVGDKKQSIYGFRGARVELFEKLRKDLERQGQALTLKDNFRSDERIIEHVNRSFESLMEGYEPIKANRRHGGQNNICFLTMESQGTMSERRQKEGEMIAKKILEMISDESVKVFDRETQKYRRPSFRDFAVLLRRKTHIKHYVNAFKAHEIPFYVADTGSIMEDSSVKNILCALNTVAFQDNINLYGTLAHLFKISDEELAEYVLMRQELISGLGEDASYDDISESLAEAFKLILMWCKIKDRATLRELAQRIADDTMLLAAAAQNDLLEVENVFKFLDLCRDYDEQGYTLREFLEELSDFGWEQQEAIDVSEEEDVVKFVTIHSSKGLEFPIVILADSGQEISGIFTEVLFEPKIGLALKKDRDKWEMLKKYLNQKEIEEAKRLLYVALTRARDYLLISGEMKSDKKDSFLKWLNPESITDSADDGISVETIWELADAAVNTVDLQEKEPKLGKKQIYWNKHISVPRSFSVTSIGEFARCPRRYYLSNQLGIPEKLFYKDCGDLSRLSARERGTIVHELIEKIHKENIKVNNKEEILAINSCPLNFQDRRFIERCLQNYLESDLYNTPGVVYSEMPFTYHLGDRRYITGKIDHLILEEDGATVVDFKTNSMIDSDLMKAYRLQVMAYALAVSEIYGIIPKKAVIASLFEGKMVELDISLSSLEECKAQICSIINRIENDDFNGKTQIKTACGICAYKGILCE
ncbi:exodeoxyribonuclease V subunit beta [Tepidanaerobacter sp. EBM-38]|uniref:UvrD-helicase domain-containing protein n=1 Tax=Tepidanaerobacter sp. EBM-38 TaxID=1918496 RepID=UPI000B040F55|nr:UvrD-helicase domain-containing protein [Tepidanaerobacter sp. EBM-38]